MKITVDIPDKDLAEAMRFAKARTERDAVLTCIDEYNRRRRMALLVWHLGTFSDDFPSHSRLESARNAKRPDRSR